MLAITTKSRTIEWHIGEPWPRLNLGLQSAEDGDGRVIRFQADGHELDFMLDVLRRSSEVLGW